MSPHFPLMEKPLCNILPLCPSLCGATALPKNFIMKYHLKMDIWVKTIVNITINTCELYTIKEYKIFMVNIDFCHDT